MDVFSLVGKLELQGQAQVEGELQKTRISSEQVQKSLLAAGAAMTAVGAVGLKLVGDARQLNAELGQTALTLGMATGELRQVALETTNVTFPLQSVAATFDILARAGVENKETMQASATAFDTLGDATGSSGEAMAELLIPAFKLFGEEIPATTAELDKFTWLTKNTTVDISDFGTLLTRMAPYMDDLDMSMEDAVATLAALSEHGIEGTAATLALRTAITQAASSGEDLNTTLGLSQDEIDGYKRQMNDAVGITDDYATVANTQYGIMDELRQKWDELKLQVGSFLTPVEGVLGAMTAAGPVLMGAGGLVQVLPMLTKAIHGLNLAMLANPVVWVVAALAAVAAAGYMLWKHWDTVATAFLEIWQVIRIGVGNAVSGIVNWIEGMANAVIDNVNAVIRAINTISPKDIPLLDPIVLNWADGFKDMADTSRDELGKIRANFGEAESKLSDRTKAIIDGLNKTKGGMEDVGDQSKETGDQVADADRQFRQVSDTLSVFQKNLHAVNLAGPEFTRVMDGFIDMGFGFKSAFDLASVAIGKDFTDAIETLVGAMEGGTEILEQWRQGEIDNDEIVGVLIDRYGSWEAALARVKEGMEDVGDQSKETGDQVADADRQFRQVSDTLSVFQTNLYAVNLAGPEFTRVMDDFVAMGFSFKSAFDLASVTIEKNFTDAIETLVGAMEGGTEILEQWRQGEIANDEIVGVLIEKYGSWEAALEAVKDMMEETTKAQDELNTSVAVFSGSEELRRLAAISPATAASAATKHGSPRGLPTPSENVFQKLVAGAMASSTDLSQLSLKIGDIERAFGSLPESPKMMLPVELWQHGGMISEPTLLYGLRSMRPYAVAGEAGPEMVVPSGGGSSLTIDMRGAVIYGVDDLERKISEAMIRARGRGAEV